MAFPTIPTVASGDLLSSTTATAGTTHTFPNLSSLRGGAGPQAGDLLIAICVQYQGGTANAEFSGWGAGFTETRDDATVTALDMAVGVAHKIATGSESGTFSVTSAHSFISAQFLMRIPAATWHGTTIPEVLAAVRATGAVADPGSFNPTNWDAEDTLWISVCGQSETTTTGTPPVITTAPTNYSGALIVARAADAVGNVTAAVGFRQLNASAEDVGAWTVTNALRGNGLATVIAIRPYAAPPPTQTGTARISLASASTPETQTSHSIKVRARVTSGAGRIRAALYQGSTNITDTAPGYLESNALTNAFADYTLAIADADAASITDYSNLEIRLWGYSAGGGAIVYEVSKLFLETPAAGVTAVSKTLTSSYNIVGQVSKALTSSYNLRTEISKALAPSYNIRVIASKTLTASYAVRAYISKALSSSYNVVGRLSKLFTANYNLRTTVNKVLTASYNIVSLSAISKTLTASYNVQVTTSKDLTVSYNIASQNAVSKTLTASYNVKIIVSKGLSASYVVKTIISKALSPSYSIRVSVSKTLTASYAIVGRISKALTASYSILSAGATTSIARISLLPANRPVPQENHSIKVRARLASGAGVIRVALYDGNTNITGTLETNALTGSFADYTIPITNELAADITQYDNLELRLWGFDSGGGTPVFQVAKLYLEIPAGLANIKKNLVSSYNLRTSVSKSLTSSYNITAPALTKLLVVSYNITGKVQKTFSAQYAIQVAGPRGLHNLLISWGVYAVSKSLTANYSIGGAVSKTLTSSYNVKSIRTKTLTASYNTRTSTSKTLTTSYNVKAQISKQLVASYSIQQIGAISKSLTADYSIRSTISKALAPSYTVRSIRSKALIANYTIKVKATKTLAPSYSIRSIRSKALTSSYTIFQVGVVGKTLSASYNVRNTKSKTLTSSYAIRTSTSKQLITSYNIAIPIYSVSQSLVISYIVSQTITKSLSAYYAIGQLSKVVVFAVMFRAFDGHLEESYEGDLYTAYSTAKAEKAYEGDMTPDFSARRWNEWSV